MSILEFWKKLVEIHICQDEKKITSSNIINKPEISHQQLCEEKKGRKSI